MTNNQCLYSTAEEIKYRCYSNHPVAIALGASLIKKVFESDLPLATVLANSRLVAKGSTPGDPQQRLGSHTVDFACKFESYGKLVGRIERVKVNLMTADHTHFGPIRGGLS